MENKNNLEIFLVTVPGLEMLLREEAVEKGFRKPKIETGGVSVVGDWPTVWRANLELRGASKVLVRLAQFRADHLSVLDKRARQVPWGDILRPDVPVQVEATCRKSRIYHSGAAAERITQAIERNRTHPPDPTLDGIRIKARIVRDQCTISIDTSGEGLHKRGHKEAVNAAPLRETLASLSLRYCEYKGKEPVLDPMCGSGTFVIEAAEIAARLKPGRSRHFAFEHLATFDDAKWQSLRQNGPRYCPDIRFYGCDADLGGVRMSIENCERAGVIGLVDIQHLDVINMRPPEGQKGLVITNPPYGGRIGDGKRLSSLYATFGRVMREHFAGWRVGLVTNSSDLANATGLEFERVSPSFSHGGISVNAYLAKIKPTKKG